MIYIMIFLSLNFGAVQKVEVAPTEVLQLVVAGKESGHPVVLIPGLSGCAYGYRKVVPPLLEAGYRTIILEPLAVGSSSKPTGVDYSLTAQAHRVAAVLDSLQVERAIVVGHGVSASISLRLALCRPDLVQAIVSVEGGPEDSAATPTVKKSLKIASLVAKFGGDRILRDKFRSNLEAASGDKSWVTKRNVRKYFGPMSRDLSASIGALREMSLAIETVPIGDNLHLVVCPVLLLTGAAPHEGGLSAQEVAELAGGLSLFSHRSVPGAGHFIFEENPEAVVQAVQDLNLRPGSDGHPGQTAHRSVGQQITSHLEGGRPCVR